MDHYYFFHPKSDLFQKLNQSVVVYFCYLLYFILPSPMTNSNYKPVIANVFAFSKQPGLLFSGELSYRPVFLV